VEIILDVPSEGGQTGLNSRGLSGAKLQTLCSSAEGSALQQPGR